VLDGIDLHVPKGTIFSLLGPNGAGKTTAVKILSTLIRADGGEVQVAATTWLGSPTPFAPRSVSPASSRQWTTSSLVRRT
jgi:ABC-2 type transport system ATP-binding protein